MPDLILGPPIGTVGGASDPLDLSPDSPVQSQTVDLPDGEWCLAIAARNTHAGTAGQVIVDGVSVQGVSGTSRGASEVTALVRHCSGSVQITTSGVSTNVTFSEVIAFPDPIGDDSH